MSFDFGVTFAVAALFILGAIKMDALKDALNLLQADIDKHLEADKLKDGIIAEQAAEIERLEANQADPAEIEALTAQVTTMSAKLLS